jgi:hypothetical protein
MQHTTSLGLPHVTSMSGGEDCKLAGESGAKRSNQSARAAKGTRPCSKTEGWNEHEALRL